MIIYNVVMATNTGERMWIVHISPHTCIESAVDTINTFYKTNPLAKGLKTPCLTEDDVNTDISTWGNFEDLFRGNDNIDVLIKIQKNVL